MFSKLIIFRHTLRLGWYTPIKKSPSSLSSSSVIIIVNKILLSLQRYKGTFKVGTPCIFEHTKYSYKAWFYFCKKKKKKKKTSGNERMKFFHVTPRSRDNRVWKFIRRTRINFASSTRDSETKNNQQKIVPRMEMSGKKRTTFE